MSNVEEVRVPQEHVNDDTVVIVDWLVDDLGDVAAGDPVVTIETSKSTFEVEAPRAGVVRHLAQVGDSIAIGAVICLVADDATSFDDAGAGAGGNVGDAVEAAGAADAHAASTAGSDAVADAVEASSATVRLSRKARALAEARGVDEAVFAGRGLVKEGDVLAWLGDGDGPRANGAKITPARRKRAGSAKAGGGLSASADAMPVEGRVPVRVEPVSRQKGLEIAYLRSGLARTLPSQVVVSVPTRDKAAAEARNPSLRERVSACVIFETARLLRKYPRLNGYYDAGNAHLYEQVNIGFAIDGEHGLKVPVIRGADEKSLDDIVAETRERVVEYVDDAIMPDAFADGTFTVSNLAGEGVRTFSPLINHGQAAILGVGADTVLPGMRHGAYDLVLVFDHQLSAGREAAHFLGDLRERMQGHEEALVASSGPAPLAETPHCDLCLRPVDELEGDRRHLIQTVDREGARQLVCEICFQGW